MNCSDAKKISIVDFLKKLGIHPVKVIKNDYWYISPIRKEEEPSFKVSGTLNLWFDHGLGKGGNLIDLATLIYQCSVQEALVRLCSGRVLVDQPIKQLLGEDDCKLSINNVLELNDIALTGYIESRKISSDIVRRFAKEVHYTVKDNTYIFRAIGLPTVTNGWELHTPTRDGSFKNSTTPKSISYFKFNLKEVAIFEGQFDFYSIWSFDQPLAQNCDFIVLNSLSLKEKAIDLLIQYSKIHLFLDNDAAGNSASAFYSNLELSKSKVINHSQGYGQSKDLNDHLRGKFLDNTPKVPPKITPDINKPNRGITL